MSTVTISNAPEAPGLSAGTKTEVQTAVRPARRSWSWLQVLAGAVVCAMFLLPFFWMIGTSVKTPKETFAIPPTWIPRELTSSNYTAAVTTMPFVRYAWNTALITGLSVLGALFSCPLCAYGFARLQWRGRDFLFMLLLSTMILPWPAVMIPSFLIFKSLGWINTILPLVVPFFLGGAFYIFMLRQFFLGIPEELSESARIDGCTEFGVYWRIILPLAKPALSIVALFVFVGTWTDFLGPLIYLNDESKLTLSLGLQLFVSQFTQEWGPLMAASTLIMLPVVVVFAMTQRFFLEGIATTGLKG